MNRAAKLQEANALLVKMTANEFVSRRDLSAYMKLKLELATHELVHCLDQQALPRLQAEARAYAAMANALSA